MSRPYETQLSIEHMLLNVTQTLRSHMLRNYPGCKLEIAELRSATEPCTEGK